MNPILSFQGEHRFLSNFWPCNILMDGQIYPSVENAYQAAKAHPSQRGPFRACTPGAAKRLGRAHVLPSNWDSTRGLVMAALIAQKFMPREDLGRRLVATGDARLVEGNTWGDTFWGVCRGRGENRLGEILMQRRAQLAALEVAA